MSISNFFNLTNNPLGISEDSYLLTDHRELDNPSKMLSNGRHINKVFFFDKYIHVTDIIITDQLLNIKIYTDSTKYYETTVAADFFINKRYTVVMDKTYTLPTIKNNIELFIYINNPMLFQSTCDFFFHGNYCYDYSKVDLNILFILLEYFTTNNRHEQITNFFHYINYHLDLGEQYITKVFIKIRELKLPVPIDYLMAYILERRNDTTRYFSFITNNTLHYPFINVLIIMYINQYTSYDVDISVENLIQNQNIIIHNSNKSELYHQIVDYENLIVFLPINSYYLNKHDQNIVQRYSALKRYTKYYDFIINSSLRNNLIFNTISTDIEQIFEALNLTTKRKYHLYRGIAFDIKHNKDSSDKIMDKGFMSKTFLPRIAAAFSSDNCCIICFIYKYTTSLLDISTISYWPGEEEVLTFPGEIYNIIDKKNCMIFNNIITIYFVEVVGNYYENNYNRLLSITQHIPLYDSYVGIITDCLHRHIVYNDPDIDYFNGFVYLISKGTYYIFSQSTYRGGNIKIIPNISEDLGLILKNIINNDDYEFGEFNIIPLPFGTYNFTINVGCYNGKITIDKMNIVIESELDIRNIYEILADGTAELIDKHGNLYTPTMNILLKRDYDDEI